MPIIPLVAMVTRKLCIFRSLYFICFEKRRNGCHIKRQHEYKRNNGADANFHILIWWRDTRNIYTVVISSQKGEGKRKQTK